jgi:dihydrofolate reductase
MSTTKHNRKLKLQVQISVDGYVAATNGELDWMTWNLDSKLLEFINSLTDSSDTILLGRKMTEGFVNYWQGVKPDSPEFSFAQKMVNTPKVIFSKTLEKPLGKNTSLAKGDLADEISTLKNKNGKDIVVYGGATFVSSLIAGGHIDEFNLFVNPVLINKGMRIFDLLNKRQKLSLITAAPYECGVAVLRYNLNKD